LGGNVRSHWANSYPASAFDTYLHDFYTYGQFGEMPR